MMWCVYVACVLCSVVSVCSTPHQPVRTPGGHTHSTPAVCAVTYIDHNVEGFVRNVKQVLFFHASVVLLFCCFLKTCFLRKRLDALVWGVAWYNYRVQVTRREQDPRPDRTQVT